MACGLNFAMRASDGNCYLLTMNAAGQMVATPTSDASPLVLRDYFSSSSKTFAVDIVNGNLTATFAGVNPSAPRLKSMSDPSGNSWALVVDSNGLVYSLFVATAVADPIIGQCLGLDEGYPAVVQSAPGVAPTAPVQQRGGGPIYAQIPDEEMGRFRAGCGHSIQNWDVRTQAVACVSSKLICCPLCGWLQRVMSTADFLSSVNNPVTVG